MIPEILIFIMGLIVSPIVTYLIKRPRLDVKVGGTYLEAGHKKGHMMITVKNRSFLQSLFKTPGFSAKNLSAKIFYTENSNLTVNKRINVKPTNVLHLNWFKANTKIPEFVEEISIPSGQTADIRFITRDIDKNKIYFANNQYAVIKTRQSALLIITDSEYINETWMVNTTTNGPNLNDVVVTFDKADLITKFFIKFIISNKFLRGTFTR